MDSLQISIKHRPRTWSADAGSSSCLSRFKFRDFEHVFMVERGGVYSGVFAPVFVTTGQRMVLTSSILSIIFTNTMY